MDNKYILILPNQGYNLAADNLCNRLPCLDNLSLEKACRLLDNDETDNTFPQDLNKKEEDRFDNISGLLRNQKHLLEKRHTDRSRNILRLPHHHLQRRLVK